MYLVTPTKGTHILLPQLIMQIVSFIHGAFHLKLLCGNTIYFSAHTFSSKFFQVSSIIIFNGRRSNHQKLLKMFCGVSIWLKIHKCNRGTQHLKAPFPRILQWLSDNMVLANIAAKGLIWVCSYSTNAFAAFKLMTPISDGKGTKLNMAKATSLYRSFPSFPSSTFFFILASMAFHLNPPLVNLHWLIFPKHNNRNTLKAVFSNLCLK